MNEDEYTIRLIDLPEYSKGFVVYDEDNHANVYINARYNHEQQHDTADHELAHILNDDFFNDDPIELIEARAAKSLPLQGKVASRRDDERGVQPSPRPKLTPADWRLFLNAIADLDHYSEKPITLYDL